MSDQFSRAVPLDGIRGHGNNLFLGILAGIVAAIVGALLWMGVEVMVHVQVGYVALAVGALVGFAIRVAGNGTSPIYGIVGAILTLAGCLAGEVLAAVVSATDARMGFMQVLSHLNLGMLLDHIITQSSPITYFIYAIGIFEGYKLSIRK